MNFTLHQLQVFLEVVKQKSITKAAENMHMTQPALSIQLKNFQQQFDYQLTEVIGRKLYITDFGNNIAEIAESIVSESDKLKYKTKEYGAEIAGKLKVSCVSTGKYVIPYFLKDFMQNHTSVELELDVTNKSLVIESLRNNEIDFALVSVSPSDLNLEEEPLLQNNLFLVGNTPDLRKDRPFIFREKGSATRAAMDNYLSTRKVQKKMELKSNEAVKQALIAGLGYSIIPLIGIRNELANKELHIIPRKDLPLSSTWRLVWLKQKQFSPTAQAFLDYIKEHKREIVAQHFNWIADIVPLKKK
ncbi:LysR family transcriptional regulator [Flammeovirga yaeyamensis]|uniref:LysR family transcriptional regulator n=1 Tax=Flammeovirga yaeyamensis TaxID=367791 RepID=A0AAX1N9E5_9BACT|nr:LysR substrate-binding domain-containing protein [Flammeovirga yaeyamensis]MBB3699392.1 DNA-binding transcriptional LysR family regulator [Flammeovirga yaeyamensis]NMF35349.1 LysR family transcriptional regulator [Flammeovirga yaeyamensis]QWG04209.1 LysR family transcriptional regulator [Flammeovirga yaeyamensis]